jgi:Ras-related protein Rab-5C
MTERERYGIKMVILGNYSTGKTALIQRMVSGKWDPYTEATIGCAFYSMNRVSSHGVPLQYQIWDTAGQERYRSMVGLYYKKADIILLCVDVSDTKSFKDADKWMHLIRQERTPEESLGYLIATKTDLDRLITTTQLEDFARQYDLTFHETSSLHNSGIGELLDSIMTNADRTWQPEMLGFMQTGETSTQLTGKTSKSRSSCC